MSGWGDIKHTVEVGKDSFSGENVVLMTNDDDPYYEQHFENWDELNEFITNLKNAGKKAWGKHEPNRKS